MSNAFLVLGFLDDLEEGIRYAKANGFASDFITKMQKLHDDLIDISNRAEEEGEGGVLRMNKMLAVIVEECFANCQSNNQEEAKRALSDLEDCLKKL